MKRLLCAFMVTASVFAAPVLVLNPPGGELHGVPGATVGWGFTLTNTDNYLIPTLTSFVPTPLSAFGVYQDYLASGPNLVVVGPGNTSVTQAFDSAAMTGIGAFHIAPTSAITRVSGRIVVNYSLYSRSPNDPLFNPDTDLVVSDATVSALAAVDIVPEPSSLLLVGCVVGAFIAKQRFRSGILLR